jgi:hypothetical protein
VIAASWDRRLQRGLRALARLSDFILTQVGIDPPNFAAEVTATGNF